MVDQSKKLTFGSDRKGSVAGTAMLISEDSLKAESAFGEPSDETMIGTDKPKKDGRQVIKKDVKGDIVVRPSYVNANILLQQCFDEIAGTFTPADDPNAIAIDVVVDREVDIFSYLNAWLSILEISGTENEPLMWRLTLLGKDEANAGVVAAFDPPNRMLFSDLTFTIAGDQYFITGFRWKFDYDLEERFHNSITRSSVGSRIPRCMLEIDIDINDDSWTDILDLAGTNTALGPVVLTFTDSVNTVTITMHEMTVTTANKFPDSTGVDVSTATVELRSWLDTDDIELDIVVITYA